MGTYNVFIILMHCFVPSSIIISDVICVIPFDGASTQNVSDLIDKFLVERLGQPLQPNSQKKSMIQSINGKDASVIIEIDNVIADSHATAIQSVEDAVMIVRDILAYRQLVRGIVAGFISIRTDVSTPELYSQVRSPAILPKIYNLPFFETESEIQTQLYEKAVQDPQLRAYLNLYADTVSHSDTIKTEIGLETRLIRTWALVEAIASDENGHARDRVKALYGRYSISTHPNFHNSDDKDLVDIAYTWRNIIAHCGSCKAATKPQDIDFCNEYSPYFEELLRELSSFCQALISRRAHDNL